MKNIKESVTESLSKLGCEFIVYSCCANVHINKFGKESKVYKRIAELFDKNDLLTEITLVVGRGGSGRNSEILLFDSSNKNKLVGTKEACYRDFFTFRR